MCTPEEVLWGAIGAEEYRHVFQGLFNFLVIVFCLFYYFRLFLLFFFFAFCPSPFVSVV